jgi:HEPN domain-containing protein
LPRKTDSSNPADWLWIAESDLDAIRLLAGREVGYLMCRSKLAEVLEKVLKAELLRSGWFLEKTHDLDRLLDYLRARQSDLVPAAKPLCDALAELYFTDRYPGFDLDDPDWPGFRAQLEQVTRLFETVKARVSGAGGTAAESAS